MFTMSTNVFTSSQLSVYGNNNNGDISKVYIDRIMLHVRLFSYQSRFGCRAHDVPHSLTKNKNNDISRILEYLVRKFVNRKKVKDMFPLSCHTFELDLNVSENE